jgi:hypothetical protein
VTIILQALETTVAGYFVKTFGVDTSRFAAADAAEAVTVAVIVPVTTGVEVEVTVAVASKAEYPSIEEQNGCRVA